MDYHSLRCFFLKNYILEKPLINLITNCGHKNVNFIGFYLSQTMKYNKFSDRLRFVL